MIFIDETLHPLGATGYDALAGTQIVKHIKSVDIIAIATAVTVWTAVLTVAIGCFMVMMKGCAYVADAYERMDSERPKSR